MIVTLCGTLIRDTCAVMFVEKFLIRISILAVLPLRKPKVGRLSGSIVHSVENGYTISRQKTFDKGKYEITTIVLHLNVGGGDFIITRAHNFYKIAVERNFTKGRRTSQVAAACLYLACRQTEKAFLLIDFSDYLKTSVYVLGGVFLQLCKMLRLSEHPIVQKLIDPSLFIHRFTERLLGQRNNRVSETALRIVASMKRDWMQTGRKPSGLCGAALYISALSHGFNYSKSDIVTVVHICEATLTKRLIEFENTESGCLTIEEFIARADELNQITNAYQSPTPGEVLCQHKDTDEPHFAHGLCRKCYNEFIILSGGLKGGAEPPAFQRAEKQRMENSRLDKMPETNNDVEQGDMFSKHASYLTMCEQPTLTLPKVVELQPDYPDIEPGQDLHEEENCDPESFSDIDDVEVDGYLHNEEEKYYKKIIWEEMNKEYLEEQAAKEAAAAAVAKEAFEAKLAAATAAALANSRKEKRQKRAEERKNARPANSPLEATRQVLKRKSFSSKINYKALENLFTDSVKKQSETGEIDSGENDMKKKDVESDGEAVDDGDDKGTVDAGFDNYYNDGDDYYGYDDGGDHYYYGNGDEDYGFD
ncbi:hypothetical protein HPP92_004334 [Vanilla planifolia]|uniref:Cyclin-like domain-containing protein n=1 Tax=Vanilla planifolia TaxID=51239 RepID=A0A835VJU1_VANPL|nr:hypothetical protein HPP92_004334 [Vanilla planifolia]